MTIKNKPYISFVIVGRNDNFNGRYMYRLQNFIDHLVYSCEKFGLDAEIIVVEWNPPERSNRLYEELRMPKNLEHVSIRFIEVPNNIHKKFENSDNIHFFEFIGKNVGIRRANGDFVLITNTDIIFDEELIDFFSKKKLKDRVYYRVNRYNIIRDLPPSSKVWEMTRFCKANWSHCWSPRFGNYPRILRPKDFIRILSRTVLKYFDRFSYLKYYGGAPGDFMLLSKKGWEGIRGFPETSFARGLLDGYSSIQIITNGNKLKILEGLNTYHQYHGKSPIGYRKEQHKEYMRDVRKMLKENKAIINNSSDWGLVKYRLKEKIIL